MRHLIPDAVWTPDGLKKGWQVSIDEGVIVAVGPASAEERGGERLAGKLLLPGLVNAHSHAFQRAFRGHVQWTRSDDDSFWTWRDAMYGQANRLSPEGIEAVSALAFLEMAEAGVTEVGEFHYLHHQPDGTRYADPDELGRRVIAAALRVGIRITLLRVAYASSSPGEPLNPDQRRFGDSSPDEVLGAAERLSAHPDPRVSVGIAPHSIRAVPLEWMPELATFTGPIHTHVSEQPAEVRASLEAYGGSPLHLLDQQGLVSDRFTAVHMTFPEPGDAAILRARGARICVCPSTELDLGDGFLPLELRKGIELCVGSDSHAQIDLFHEARALELHGRALANRRHILTPVGERHGLAEALLQAATRSGARALGRDGHAVQVGASADLIAVQLDRPAAQGVPALEAAAFNANPDWVEDVWVGGERIATGGRHPRRDEIVRAASEWLPTA